MRVRTLLAVSACALFVMLATQTSSAVPRVHLVSPAIGPGPVSYLECQVTNMDDSSHTAEIKFYDSTGTLVSGNPPQTMPPHGSAGLSFPPGFGANHCEITADGRPEFFRASIDVLTTPGGPPVLALPIW